jgi:predicted membrane protein
MIYFKLLANKLALFIFFVAIMLFFDVSLLAAAVTFTYFPVVIGLLVRKLIKCKGVIEDVKKNLLFLSNEEKINSDIRNKSEVRENIVEEVRGKVFSLDNGSFPFSFNSIDKISFDELKEIYDSAVEPKESNNAKVLSKKKIRNKR